MFEMAEVAVSKALFCEILEHISRLTPAAVTPGSLAEAVDALEKDHKFLTAGDVFTDDLVQMWITWKRQEELDPMALRPHPYEFHLYYDS